MKALAAKETGWWMGLNPLLGLSLERAQQIYDAARRGCSPLLHRVYDAIEAADPVLMTCVERRSSALAGLGWHSTARAGVDDGLAKEQRQFIDDLADGIGDLEEALEHLDLAFFRGFSHVQPLWEGGRVRRIQTLDSWNFMRRADGTWLWNPEAKEGDGEGLEEITPEARLVTVRRPRAIDYPAMAIHIRKALGERDWGRFVERYGIPPVDAVMAAGATEEQRNEYLAAAEAARDGRCVVWPSGSTVSRAEGARGQDPFSAFQEHQERLVVLMATGGTLTSLAQADTGSLAGGAQMDVWEEIVRRDAKIIGAALDRALFRPAVEAAFPGRPVAAQFELGTEATPSTAEVFETAGKARAAGYRVAQEELEEASGYSLVPDAADTAAPTQLKGSEVERLKGSGLQLFNSSTVQPDRKVAASPLLRAFAKDTGAAAERMAALLDKLDAGEDVAAAARKLADELPGLMKGEPQLAAVLEEEMAKAFAGEIEAAKNAKDTKGEKAVANAGTSEGARKGWETRRRNGWTPKQYEENKAKVDSLIADLDKTGPDGKGKGWKNREESFGDLDAGTVADIKKANPDMDVEHSEAIVDTAQLSHAMREHGEGHENRPGQIPITHEDLAKIPDVLSDYDSIERGKGKADGKPTEAVVFRKAYDDGTIACVELDMYSESRQRRVLKFQTMWKETAEETK